MVDISVSSNQEDNIPVKTPEEIARDKAIARVDAGATEEELAQEFGITQKTAREFSIKRHYDAGHGTIQDYARIYKLSVAEVLAILDHADMDSITFIGDLIDQEYAGKVPVNPDGETYKINYTVD